MNSKRVLIFDFDGTLVDSELEIYRLVNNLTPNIGNKNFDMEDVTKIKDLSSNEIVSRLNLSWYKLPFVYLRFRHEYSKLLNKQKPSAGIIEVLDKFKEKGVKMFIVSSSPKRNITRFLIENNMDYFKSIEVIFGFYGKDTAIKKIIYKEDLKPENVIYIGDETRDIEAAHKAGVMAAAVVWGVNSEKILRKFNPDFLISKPEELLKL